MVDAGFAPTTTLHLEEKKVAYIGVMERVYDPDELYELEQLPDGILSCSGAAMAGEDHIVPVVQMRIVLGDEDVRFVISAEKAEELSKHLHEAISDAFAATIEQGAEELAARDRNAP